MRSLKMFGRNSILSKRKRTDQHTARKGDLRPPAIRPPEQSNKGSPWPPAKPVFPSTPLTNEHIGCMAKSFLARFRYQLAPKRPLFDDLCPFVPYRTNLAPTDSFCGPSGLLLGFHRVLPNPIRSLCNPFGRQATIKKVDGIQWNALEALSCRNGKRPGPPKADQTESEYKCFLLRAVEMLWEAIA